MSEADPASPAGTRLQNYEIDTVLGQGAFGITYRARDTTLNRDVAIKEYLPTSLALLDEMMDRLAMLRARMLPPLTAAKN